MKKPLAALLLVAVSAAPALSEPRAKSFDIPDFTIHTTAPERTIYAIVKYCHDNGYYIPAQRVVGIDKYEIRVHYEQSEVVLFLHVIEEEVRSEGSRGTGDERFYSERLAPLMRSLENPERHD